ncbi:DNRLRE domain-containing protein [Streptomyces sp. NBC_01304]|uniref:DNRLRE domain-containing protein n=1 Tax=Streptomyces sp. NBC_01304 TaxID=2903818 RepID=UPI002E118C51|nr:DNRLRE domain-containing protein [Streptomyces sp. NBC_01304]
MARLAMSVALVMGLETALVVGDAGAFTLAHPAGAAAERSEPTGPAEAENEASAQLTARLQNRRIEVLSARSETSTEWAYPDGRLQLEEASGPVRFRRGDAWVDVDLTLRRQADGSVAPGAHPRGLVLSGAGSGKSSRLASLVDGDGSVALLWPGVLPEPELEGQRATYKAVRPGVDLVVEATRTGFEDFLIVHDRKSARALDEVQLTVRADGLDVKKQADGEHVLVDAKDQQLGVIETPTGWDAEVQPQSQDPTDVAELKVRSSVSEDGDTAQIGYQLADAYVQDTDTKFPVTIDPGISLRPSLDTFVEQGYTQDQSDSPELKLGNNGTKQIARSFLAFPTKQVRNKHIIEAELRLFNHHSWSCTPREWEVWESGVPHEDTRWTNQPKWLKKIASSTETKGGDAHCPGGWAGVKVTPLVQQWADKGPATAGIGLRATDEADSLGWKRFSSAEGAHPPTLVITLTSGLQPPVNLLAVPGRTTIGRRWVSTATPQLSGTVSSGSGGKLQKVAFELTDEHSKALTTHEQEGVPSGQQARWTVTHGVLKEGGTYGFRMRAFDGHVWSGWSVRSTFHVYNTPAPLPKVASHDFPHNGWGGKLNAHGQYAGKFSITADTYAVSYRIDDGSWTAHVVAPNEPSQLSIAVSGGKHTLQIRAVNRAGVPSKAVDYVFYAGPGAALISPGTGERTARRAALNAQGKHEHTHVAYQYRRAVTDHWTTIPAKDVRTTTGGAVTWPVVAKMGHPAALTWTVADTLGGDGSVQVRAHFTGGKEAFSDPHHLVLDLDAGTAPQPAIGPGTVNLLTGAYTLNATDAQAWGVSAERTAVSRRHVTPAHLGLAEVFGPGWSAGSVAETSGAAYTSVRKTSGSSVQVMFADGDGIHFTRTNSGWQPEVGSEDLTLTGSEAGTFTLTDTAGIKTTFKKASPQAATWLMTTSERPVKNSTTEMVYEPVTVNHHTLARPKYIVAPTSAVKEEVCAKTPATRGCRVLEYVYATATTADPTPGHVGDMTGQVKQIRLWATAPGATKSTPTVIAAFAYGISKRLYEAWDPRITPALKTVYRYDAAQRITGVIPPGEQPYTFTYGRAAETSTAGEGMLLKVSRPALKAGSKTETDGTATESVVYNVALTGPPAPVAMTPSKISNWGQSDAPTDATAIFPADVSPASHDGAQLSRADYHRADVSYINASGRQTNHLEPGGHLTTTEYDHFGNTVRSLSAGNRTLALGTSTANQQRLIDLGLDPQTTTSAERAQQLSRTSAYSADGLRELDSRGPLHAVLLPHAFHGADKSVIADANTVVEARDWNHRTFDEGRPSAGAKVKDLPTTQASGLELPGHPGKMAETRTGTTAYDWTKGTITKTVQDPDGLAITHTTSYDDAGKPIQSTMPKSGGADAGTTLTDYYTAADSTSCGGRPEWADLPCRSRHAAPADAGTNRELPDMRSEYDYYGNPVKNTATSNGATRTATSVYDAAERLRTASLTASTGSAIGARTITYDQATGRPTGMSADGKSVHMAYDALGRTVSYTDADGAVTSTEYDRLDRPTRVTNGAPSTASYTYDTNQDPRGLLTSVTEDKFGTIAGHYDDDGALTEQTFPGGITTTDTYDPAGTPTTRRYQRTADQQTIASEAVLPGPHAQWASQISSNTGHRRYLYDNDGRLARSEYADLAGPCTVHGYAFDSNSNRLAKTTDAALDGKCGSGTTSTERHSYDSADRLSDKGFAHDQFGNITAQPGGITTAYFVDDLVHQQQTNALRTMWDLDPLSRRRTATTQTKQENGSWDKGASELDHFDNNGDSPAWTVNQTSGGITRYVEDLSGELIGTVDGTQIQLNLPDLHGDTTLTVSDGSHVEVRAFDEYGIPAEGQSPAGYGWLGAHQRSAQTPTGDILMGARLYNPALGRFLQVDPVAGGSANAYDYSNQDPVDEFDLNGLRPHRGATHHAARSYGHHNTRSGHHITQSHRHTSSHTPKWHSLGHVWHELPWHKSIIDGWPRPLRELHSYAVSHFLHADIKSVRWQDRQRVELRIRSHNGRIETEERVTDIEERFRAEVCVTHGFICRTFTSRWGIPMAQK